jgi:nitroreductase
MDLQKAIRTRHMCRDFAARPVAPELVDQLLDLARRAPSAGHTQGWAFVVLEGREETGRFWTVDADPEWLAQPDHPGLLDAPVLILPFCHRQAYLDRYAAADKAASGLTDLAGWPAPYWLIDAAFATMLLLLGAVDAGLGALFFRLHGDPGRLRAEFDVPLGWDAIGAVALGWPAPVAEEAPRRRRPVRARDQVVHRGGW